MKGLTSTFQLRRAILRLMRPVDAVYENGLLRPVATAAVTLCERVALIVVRRPDSGRWDLVRLAAHGDDDLAWRKPASTSWATALDREEQG